MKIGIVFGCFIPLHTGHMELIKRALTENDQVIIAVCGKDTDRGKDFIPFRDRINLIKRIYFCSIFHIVAIDDEKIGMDGTFTRANWVRWSNELFDQVGWDPNSSYTEYTWYTGEPSYQEKLGSIYPNHKIVIIDRAENTISGTKIRENPTKYKDSIHPRFVEYLKQKGFLL